MKKLIAVYGTLRKGGVWHDNWLKKARFVGSDLLKDYELSIGQLPYIKPENGKSVIVEVYEVDQVLFGLMDRFETNAGYIEANARPKLDLEYKDRVSVWVYNKEIPEVATKTDGDYIQFLKNRGIT